MKKKVKEEKKTEEEIATKDMTETMAQDMKMGEVFAKSGVFPDIKTAAQGYVKVLAGKELGLSPIQSLNSFYFVSGKLGILARTMSALVKKSEKYDYTIDTHNDQECVITFYKINGKEPKKVGQSKFDIKMAAKAGIVNKDNWKSYPMNMLFARALSNGIRWFCPDAVSSFSYSVEELEDLSAEDKKETITIKKDKAEKVEEDKASALVNKIEQNKKEKENGKKKLSE